MPLRSQDWANLPEVTPRPENKILSAVLNALGQSVYQGARDFVTLPGDVYQGKKRIEDVTPEDTMGWALNVVGGGSAIPKPSGSLGSSGVIKGFHASPRDWADVGTRPFDEKYIGTGEGSTSRGWGFYLAKNPAVADRYYEQFLRDEYQRKIAARAASRGESLPPMSPTRYEVAIHATPENILNFDQPLYGQPAGQKLISRMEQDFLESLQERLDYGPGMEVDELTGNQLFQLITKHINEDVIPGQSPDYAVNHVPTNLETKREIARYLDRHDIVGSIYEDKVSRGAADTQEKTHNYAIHRPNILEIIRKYGITGLFMGAGAAGAYNEGT